MPRKLWLRFANVSEYEAVKERLFDMIKDSDGQDTVVIYCAEEKKRIILPSSQNVRVSSELLYNLRKEFGDKNVATT